MKMMRYYAMLCARNGSGNSFGRCGCDNEMHFSIRLNDVWRWRFRWCAHTKARHGVDTGVSRVAVVGG